MMIITTLYTYPIKSLRPISLTTTTILPTGPIHDRKFMLIRPALKPGEHDENMQVSHYSQLCLFQPTFIPAGTTPENAEAILVTYQPPTKPRNLGVRAKNGVLISGEKRELRISLYPKTDDLARRDVMMHNSGCQAVDMGDEYAQFFEGCLGIEVRLLYLGDVTREVLGNVAPGSSERDKDFGWLSQWLPSDWVGERRSRKRWGITFSDCAPLLITSEWSLKDVSQRFKNSGNSALEDDSSQVRGMDMSKFRPNLVLGGEEYVPAWDEDFWAELLVQPKEPSSSPIKIQLTQNCIRCRSINVEYESAEFGNVNEPGGEEPLKYLMKDRRVDAGSKWSPVFGRYGFLEETVDERGHRLSVGDKVEVVKKNAERTIFSWPGLTTN